MFDFVPKIINYIACFLALILVLPIHEFAHAFVAVKYGDITPKINNRYTLNPFAHFDALGLICFCLAGFGWAKPVPVNPYNFKNYKWGCFWVAIAGVIANYLLAFIVFPIFNLSLFIPEFGYFTTVLQSALYYVYSYSLVFCVFNLIPIYPLDGFRVLDALNKKRGSVFRFLRDKGRIILLILFALGVIADATGLFIIDILGNTLGILSTIIGYPIQLFWGLIL